MKKIKVLIVDDSAVIRQVISAVLAESQAIEVIAAVADPLFAMQRMRMAWPDVIVLDIEMPRMDGITFLRKIMSERPTPVVICSSLTTSGAETTMQALSAGAFAIVARPMIGIKDYLLDSSSVLIDTVKAAACAKVGNLLPRAWPAGPIPTKLSADAILPPPGMAMSETTDRVVALGTSTGGTQALEVVLSSLPRVSPGIVVVQHMPEKFTAAFAMRLDNICQIVVKEAKNGDRVIQGQALIAPGGKHMLLKRNGAQYNVELSDGPRVNRHRPSVDVLFRSVAQFAGRNALGIIMTGMGDDGARGLLEMRNAGALTFAQDEETCVVFGMPQEALKRGATAVAIPLHAIADEIIGFGALH